MEQILSEGGIKSKVKKKRQDYNQCIEGRFNNNVNIDPIIKVLPPGEEFLEIALKDAYETHALCQWNFPGKEGMKTSVIVLSDDSEVELFINGETCGKKKVGAESDYYAVFEVAYIPGLIEVISYHNNFEYGRAVLK